MASDPQAPITWLQLRFVCVVATDLQALEATRRAAAAANAVGGRVEVRAPRNLPPLTDDLLVSNILAKPLSGMAQRLSILLEPGGRQALAGILKEQAPAVVASFAPWCALRPVALRDDCVLLAGNRGDDGA